MSVAVPQMIGLLAGGGIVTLWGQYVGFLLLLEIARLSY